MHGGCCSSPNRIPLRHWPMKRRNAIFLRWGVVTPASEELPCGPCRGSNWSKVWYSASVVKPSYQAPGKMNPKCTDDNFTLTSSTSSSTSLGIPAQLPSLQQLACSLLPSLKATPVPSSCGTSSTSFNLSKSQKKVENLPSFWRRDDV